MYMYKHLYLEHVLNHLYVDLFLTVNFKICFGNYTNCSPTCLSVGKCVLHTKISLIRMILQ